MRHKKIKAPYKTYTGRVIKTDYELEAYNRIQNEINMWIDAGREVPEHLLNESHRTFEILANLDNPKYIGQ